MLSVILCLLALAATSTITARPDAARTPQNTPVTTSVLNNDASSGAPLDPGSVTIVTPSANGTAAVNPDGTVTFTPAAGFVGTATYSYRVCDTSTPAPVCTTAIVTVTVTASSGARTGGRIRVSIKNEYEVALNFGPLGKGSRSGTDRAEGVLERQGTGYVGIVTASVDSTQTMSGLTGNCGPAIYQDSQKLRVTGYPESSFNPQVQSVYSATMSGQPSSEFIRLEFAPETMTSQQPGPRRPEDMLPDLVISCHTLIDTLSGIAFLPLNDSRWTTEGIGYIIVLPTSGTLTYTDNTVASPGGAQIGPFNAKKSVWTIEVERLP
jgi:hypothetical protein